MQEITSQRYLTQNADLPIEQRQLFKKIATSNADLWREATENEITAVTKSRRAMQLIEPMKRKVNENEVLNSIIHNVIEDYIAEPNGKTFSNFLTEVKARYNHETNPKEYLREEMNSKELADEDAILLTDFFPKWGEDIKAGTSLTAGYRFQYNGKLWEVRQSHSVNINQVPSVSTAALYKEVVLTEDESGEANSGTKDNPIAYDGNMELFKDKYYTQGGKLYLCIRNSEQPMYHALSGLVGNYVELVTE